MAILNNFAEMDRIEHYFTFFLSVTHLTSNMLALRVETEAFSNTIKNFVAIHYAVP